jgi:flagellar FliL protein
MNKGGKPQTNVTDPESPYIGKKPIFSWYTDIGTVTTRTRDEGNYSVSVVMNIGYDQTDTTASSELSGRKLELQEFVRRYFAGKTAEELKPDNEERLKQEIKEQLNNRYLDTARVRDITFTKFDVMEVF